MKTQDEESDPKEAEVAVLMEMVRRLKAENIELRNYVLILDRELQTGELSHIERALPMMGSAHSLT